MSANEPTKTLAELINQIKIRPELYLGNKKIATLSIYLEGYLMAYSIYDTETDVLAEKFPDFHFYVANKFNDKRTVGWHNLIAEKCNGNDETAMQMFFDILEEFMTSLNIK